MLPKECFYSSLRDGKRDRSNGHISDEQSLHLQNFWNIFNFNTLEDFHNHYFKKDILLLADAFEKFISTCLKYYGVDPCHYFSVPGLSWDAMRGGVSYINKRYIEASKNKHILYLDMNNLYGCAMRQYLPISIFKWVKNVDKIEQKLMRIKKGCSTGHIV